MTCNSAEIQFKLGHIPGGYSFSIKNNTIMLSGYFKNIENERVRIATQYVAIRARHYYVEEVNRLKAQKEKVNTFFVKRDASERAKAEACIKFADVWNEVEKIYKENELHKCSNQYLAEINKLGKDVRLIVAMVDPDTFSKLTAREGITLITDVGHLFQMLNEKSEGRNIHG